MDPTSAPGAPFEVPRIDIAPYVLAQGPEQRIATARSLDAACRSIGFLQVVGHGVQEDSCTRLRRAIDAFFALTPERKRALRTPPTLNRGYAPPFSEALSLSLGLESEQKDYFEAFNIGQPASLWPRLDLPREVYADNVWPGEAPGFDAVAFREDLLHWFGEAGRVARTLTRVFAEALGADPALFAQATDHSVDVLRLNQYALPEGYDVGAVTPTGMGAHTDYGILTVLWADPEPGLQVLDPCGCWKDVQPAPGALLVNLGDLTARWTNDRWRSTLHRVHPPAVEGRVRRRRSAAYFHDGNIDAVIETIPSCRDAYGASAYGPISVAEHLAAKLAGSRAGQANRAAGSEAQRALAARG